MPITSGYLQVAFPVVGIEVLVWFAEGQHFHLFIVWYFLQGTQVYWSWCQGCSNQREEPKNCLKSILVYLLIKSFLGKDFRRSPSEVGTIFFHERLFYFLTHFKIWMIGCYYQLFFKSVRQYIPSIFLLNQHKISFDRSTHIIILDFPWKLKCGEIVRYIDFSMAGIGNSSNNSAVIDITLISS